jgi:hypothetical protein
MRAITRMTSVEEIVADYPGSVSIPVRKGLPCIVCGEPVRGTLEEMARSKGWPDDEIDRLVRELGAIVDRKEG